MKQKNIIRLYKKVKRACSDYIIHGIGDPNQVYLDITSLTDIIGGITKIQSYDNFDFNLINHTQVIPISLNLNSSKSRQLTNPQKRAKNLIQYLQTQLNVGRGN